MLRSNIIYIPVEVAKRELVGKVFLATRLSNKGHTVVLFRSDVFDKYGWPSPGIYIGKNCFRTELPYKTAYYKRMKKSGISIWYLDEEGGVYAGQGVEDWQKRLKTRFDPNTLDNNDKILCWGKWQEKFVKDQNPKAETLAVGSPNFDVFDNRYREYFRDYDLVQTDNQDGYVLINTRFSMTNGLSPLEDQLSPDSPVSKLMDDQQLSETALTIGALQYLISKLILKLAQTFSDKRFLIRPHPAENPNFYLSVFRGFENVSVCWNGDAGSWIRRSSVVIHNGCTTALQAALAHKPVISYLPIEEPKASEFKLPNTIGRVCHSEEEVIEYLKNPFEKIDPSPNISDTIYGTESIERISEMLESVQTAKCNSEKRKEVISKIIKITKYNNSYDTMRKIYGKISKKAEARIEKEEKKFDFGFFSQTGDIHEIAESAYRADTNCIEFERTCYVFYPKYE